MINCSSTLCSTLSYTDKFYCLLTSKFMMLIYGWFLGLAFTLTYLIMRDKLK